MRGGPARRKPPHPPRRNGADPPSPTRGEGLADGDGRLVAPLCPAGHLPSRGGDWLSGMSCFSQVGQQSGGSRQGQSPPLRGRCPAGQRGVGTGRDNGPKRGQARRANPCLRGAKAGEAARVSRKPPPSASACGFASPAFSTSVGGEGAAPPADFQLMREGVLSLYFVIISYSRRCNAKSNSSVFFASRSIIIF